MKSSPRPGLRHPSRERHEKREFQNCLIPVCGMRLICKILVFLTGAVASCLDGAAARQEWSTSLPGFRSGRDVWRVHGSGRALPGEDGAPISILCESASKGFWMSYGSFPGHEPFPGPEEVSFECTGDVCGSFALRFREFPNGSTKTFSGRLQKAIRIRTDLDIRKRYEFCSVEVNWDRKGSWKISFGNLTGHYRGAFGDALMASVETGNDLFLVREELGETPRLEISNPCLKPTRAKGALDLFGSNGEHHELNVDRMLAAQARTDIKLPRIKEKGVWKVEGELACDDGSTKKVATRFGKVDLNERGPRQPFGMFRLGINYHVARYSPYDRIRTIRALNACGAKLVRSNIRVTTDSVVRQGSSGFCFDTPDVLLGQLVC